MGFVFLLGKIIRYFLARKGFFFLLGKKIRHIYAKTI
jgi:hypothetical protein